MRPHIIENLTEKQQKVVLEFNMKNADAIVLNAVNFYIEQKREQKKWIDKLAIEDAYLKTDECVGQKRADCGKRRDHIFNMMRTYVHTIDALETVFKIEK